MRILHISRTMGQGGAEKIVYQLCMDNLLDQQIVMSCGGAYVEKLAEAEIKHYKIPDLDSKNPWLMLKTMVLILGIIRKENIDIIHSHHRMAAFYGRLVSWFTNVKVLYTAHNIFDNKVWLTRFAVKKASIVAVGDGVRENLVNFFKIDNDRIVTIYNSIKISNSESCDSEIAELHNKHKIFVGTVGRLTEQKGVDIFIKAIDICHNVNPNIVGVIVGDGEDREKLERLVEERHLSAHILFMGFRKNVLNIIRQLDFIVLASRWEGLPLVPIEAFSQKKTVIASDIPGNNEVVTDNMNGILFKVDNEMELAKKIQMLSTDKDFLKNLEDRAYKTYEKKYDYKKFITAYQREYRTIYNMFNNT